MADIPGRAFELAVAAFVEALDPNAKVIFNHKVLDKDTETKRQVDVWVEAKIANHFPITIYISCKDEKRKKNIAHIGQFINDVRSTGATTGIIYSRSGFTKPAIEKAKVNGMMCCLLHENEPAKLPDVLFFSDFYLSRILSQELSYRSFGNINFTTWGEVFELDIDSQNIGIRLDELLWSQFVRDTDQYFESILTGNACFVREHMSYVHVGTGSNEIQVLLRSTFGHWRSKANAILINGSYCFQNNDFAGTQQSPPINNSIDPGEGWEELEDGSKLPIDSRIFYICHYQREYSRFFSDRMADTPLSSS